MFEGEITCQVCGEQHKIKIKLNEAQRNGVDPIIVACTVVDRRYRLMGYYIDSTRNIPHEPFISQYNAKLMGDLGATDFEKKLSRWKAIKYPPLGIIDEYPEKIVQIINTYASGHSYPAVTSACCLTERILNRLILKCRSYFTSHPQYKKIHQNQSFDNWDKMIALLKDWKLVPTNAITLFEELKKYRNESIHYNEGYDFEKIAPVVINKLIELITEVFGVLNRKDVYMVFDIPGEIWVRSEAQKLPFVKEFVLRHCYLAHAVHELDEVNKLVVERLGKKGPLTDQEFVDLRKNSLGH